MNPTVNVMPSGEQREKQKEGPIARAIEERTAQVPSDVFLWAAGVAVAGSLVFQLLQPRRARRYNVPTGMGQLSLFIGQWAPTLLLLGIYNKMVKVAGSDRASRA
jgi:hypothetical protein